MKSRNSQYFMEPVGSLLCSQEPALSQINPVHYLPSYFFESNFNLRLLSTLCLPCGLSPYDFSTKILYEFPFSPMCDMCFIYLIILDLITQIISVQGTQIMKCLKVLFSPVSVTSVLFMPKYLHLDIPIKYPTDDLDCH
jgi:hypothetical protein